MGPRPTPNCTQMLNDTQCGDPAQRWRCLQYGDAAPYCGCDPWFQWTGEDCMQHGIGSVVYAVLVGVELCTLLAGALLALWIIVRATRVRQEALRVMRSGATWSPGNNKGAGGPAPLKLTSPAFLSLFLFALSALLLLCMSCVQLAIILLPTQFEVVNDQKVYPLSLDTAYYVTMIPGTTCLVTGTFVLFASWLDVFLKSKSLSRYTTQVLSKATWVLCTIFALGMLVLSAFRLETYAIPFTIPFVLLNVGAACAGSVLLRKSFGAQSGTGMASATVGASSPAVERHASRLARLLDNMRTTSLLLMASGGGVISAGAAYLVAAVSSRLASPDPGRVPPLALSCMWIFVGCVLHSALYFLRLSVPMQSRRAIKVDTEATDSVGEHSNRASHGSTTSGTRVQSARQGQLAAVPSP